MCVCVCKRLSSQGFSFITVTVRELEKSREGLVPVWVSLPSDVWLAAPLFTAVKCCLSTVILISPPSWVCFMSYWPFCKQKVYFFQWPFKHISVFWLSEILCKKHVNSKHFIILCCIWCCRIQITYIKWECWRIAFLQVPQHRLGWTIKSLLTILNDDSKRERQTCVCVCVFVCVCVCVCVCSILLLALICYYCVYWLDPDASLGLTWWMHIII